jgi:hypothetical protein
MRSASVSDDRGSRPGPGAGGFAVVIAIAVTAGVSVCLKAVAMEQALSNRTLLLAIVAGAGGLLATLPLALLAAWIASGWRPWLRGALASLWMLGTFVPATLFAFAVENRIIEGHIEADSVTDLGASELFWTLFGAMGMFTPTGLAYLLPWPLMAVALAAFACFTRWPSARNTDSPRSSR